MLACTAASVTSAVHVACRHPPFVNECPDRTARVVPPTCQDAGALLLHRLVPWWPWTLVERGRVVGVESAHNAVCGDAGGPCGTEDVARSFWSRRQCTRAPAVRRLFLGARHVQPANVAASPSLHKPGPARVGGRASACSLLEVQLEDFARIGDGESVGIPRRGGW